ncbi:MAG: 4-carboxymuconolactone decarboxylase [Alphaproteobacteria bacterium]|nr:4-carboxymuconolactone decarboxylase [Alphaproteobacteria bacterium]
MDEKERYERGMKTRRGALGDAHVDRAEANRTPFNEDFQDFITRYAWGEIWDRPGLDKRTRSLVTLAMLVALNREAELRMHLNAARNNGVSREEIKELLLHAGLYCGLPAANASIHLAEAVFAEQDAAAGPGGAEGN